MMRRQAREMAHTALGMAMLAYGAADAVARVILNTGKRVLRMTAPSPTKELDEAIDAAFDFAIRIKGALTEASPGGKRVTLDEILSTVTDGAVRESVQDLIGAVDAIVKGGTVNVFDLIPVIAEALLDFLGTLRDALADKRVTLDELLHGVTDGNIRAGLQTAIDGIEKVPAELKTLDMWKLFALVQRIAAKLPQLLAGT